MSAYRRCWFCNAVGVHLTKEHVLSEKNFGGRLVSSNSVCATCNSAAGSVEREIVSRPPLDGFVARYSGLWGKPKRSEMEVLTRTGLWGRGRHTPDGIEVFRIHNREGQTGRPGSPEDEVAETKHGIGPKTFFEWPRFGAKVALGMASKVLDPSWLDTDGAHYVQAICAGVTPPGSFPDPQWLPFEDLNPDDPFWHLGPGEHAVGISSIDDRPAAWMILFGRIGYVLDLPDAAFRAGGFAWHLQPRKTPGPPESFEGLRERLRAGRSDLDGGRTR